MIMKTVANAKDIATKPVMITILMLLGIMSKTIIMQYAKIKESDE